MNSDLSRLDILIYAHDGRGLGHVSRSVAIGLAVRRRYPDLKVCLVTGCSCTADLIGHASLDWLKLPAYKTEVINGQSKGVDGLLGFSDRELGIIRSEQIRHLVDCFRPRVVLADHTPQGKHKELVPALEASAGHGPKWFLGMRGVVGEVRQTKSDLARQLFTRFYSGVCGYGDSRVLGATHREVLEKQFAADVRECGYVSRIKELGGLESLITGNRRYDCIVSIPWLGEETEIFLTHLVSVLSSTVLVALRCAVFLGEEVSSGIIRQLEGLDQCEVRPFGSGYAAALNSSRSAVIYGGYNSLVDVLSVGIPALVVTRGMQDDEQQQHLAALCRVTDALRVIEEKEVQPDMLLKNLQAILTSGVEYQAAEINLEGAETAADLLALNL